MPRQVERAIYAVMFVALLATVYFEYREYKTSSLVEQETVNKESLIDITTPINTIPVQVFDSVAMTMTRHSVFDSGVDGLIGWHVSINGEESIIYTSEDGESAFLGMLIDKTGTNLTEQHVAKYLSAQGAQDSESTPSLKPQDATGTGLDYDAAWKAVSLAPFKYTEGNGPLEIYVTFDPRCPYCHRYAKELSTIHDKVTVYWVPIAVLGPESVALAQRFVDTENPVAIHHQIMNRQALQNPYAPSQNAVDKITGNTRLAYAAGLTMTPVTVAMTSTGPVAIPGNIPKERLLTIIGDE